MFFCGDPGPLAVRSAENDSDQIWYCTNAVAGAVISVTTPVQTPKSRPGSEIPGHDPSAVVDINDRLSDPLTPVANTFY